MTNLKKITALSLAATSLFSTVASATVATNFSDAADVTNFDAVTTLTALGIIEGFDDGTFRPEATVTRAQMAKMIFTIRAEESDLAMYTEASTSFTDISTHWAKGYIIYCEQHGIIDGHTDGTFAPDAYVTGTQALKMALTALGYNSEHHGFTGASWAENIKNVASADARITSGVDGTNTASTRDNAAQLLYNALYATVVFYDKANGNYSIDIGEAAGFTAGTTLAEAYMDLATVEEVTVDGVLKSSVILDGYSKDSAKTDVDYTSYYGLEVDALINTSTDVLYGLKPSSEDNLSIDAVKGDLTISYTAGTASTYTVEHDGVKIKGFATDEFEEILNANSNDRIIVAKNDTDGATVHVIKTEVAQITSYVSGNRMILTDVVNSSATGTIYLTDTDDYDFGDDLAKDVLVTVFDNPFTDKIEINAIDTQSGEIDAREVSTKDYTDYQVSIDTYQYEVDGTLYTIHKSAKYDTLPKVGDTIEFSAVGAIIYALEITEGTSADISNYIAVTEVGLSNTGDDGFDIEYFWNVKVAYSDGTTGTVKVAYNDGGESDASENISADEEAPAIGLYTYEVEGGYYILNPVYDDADKFDSIAYYGSGSNDARIFEGFDKDKSTYLNINGKLVVIDDDSVFYVATKNSDVTFSSSDYYFTTVDTDIYADTNGTMTVIYHNSDDTFYKMQDNAIKAVKRVTGAELKEWSTTDFALATIISNEVNGIDHAVIGFIVIDNTSLPTVDEDVSFGYISSTRQTSDGIEVSMYTDASGDDLVTHIIDGSKSTSSVGTDGASGADYYYFNKGDVIIYEIKDASKNTITVLKVDDAATGGATMENVYVHGFDTALMNVSTDGASITSLELTDDTQYIYVDSKDNTAVADGSLNTNTDYKNAIVVYADAKVLAVYIDIGTIFKDIDDVQLAAKK